MYVQAKGNRIVPLFTNFLAEVLLYLHALKNHIKEIKRKNLFL